MIGKQVHTKHGMGTIVGTRVFPNSRDQLVKFYVVEVSAYDGLFPIRMFIPATN